MAEVRKTERILNLVSFLLKSRRPAPWRVVRREVDGYNAESESDETVERRFERDKNSLRLAGVPIEFAADTEGGERGYVIPKQAYFLPHITVGPHEALLLAVVGRLASLRSGPVSDALESALRKMQFDSPIPGGVRVAAEERFLFHRPKRSRVSHERQRLRALTDAVLRNKTVRFGYFALSSDRLTRRTVDPYGVGFVRGHWYLVGYDHKRHAVRTFRADRFRGKLGLVNAASESADFDLPADFRLDDYLGKQPWEFDRGRPVRFRIRFDRTVAWMVMEDPAAEDKWAKHADGSATLERTAADADALIDWVLGFGQHAELLTPAALRQQLIETVKGVRDLYRDAKCRDG